MHQKILNYSKAGYPAVAIRTVEESRAFGVLLDVAEEGDLNFFEWTATTGITQGRAVNDFKPEIKDVEEAKHPSGCAEAFLAGMKRCGDDAGLLIMADFHAWVKDLSPYDERRLKELCMAAEKHRLTVIFLGVEFQIPASFERYVSVVDFSLPDYDQLTAILGKIEADAPENGIELTKLENGHREDLVRAATGLTEPEARNAYGLAIIVGEGEGKTRTMSARTVYEEKAAAVKRSGLMEVIEPDPRGMEAIGGLDCLKDWFGSRSKCYSRKAREYGLPSLKGVFLCGVPGTGKSLAAKCAGALFNVPTLRLDIGALMGSLVGETEARTRQALALADAIAPCILWLDEVERALAGTSGGGAHDSGVGARLMGSLLTWSQEHKSDVFLLATSNEPWHLPAPFLRKGRWSELFYLGMPTDAERAEIAAVHLRAAGRDPEKFDLKKISKATDGFVGAEIEACVHDGMFAAFYEDREVKTKDLVGAARVSVPLSRTMAEQIERIQRFGEERCRPASTLPKCMGEKFRRETRRMGL